MTKTTISIPFPAWDGIIQVNAICDELRRNELLKGVLVQGTPRRITMRSGQPIIGFDDVKVVEYWFTSGCYATATLGGRNDSHYGMGWELVELRLRWKDEGKKVALTMAAGQIEILGLVNYFRGHIGLPYVDRLAAEKQLAEAVSEATKVTEEIVKSLL